MARADKMYKDSPELGRDEESGKMKVKKTDSKIHREASEAESGTAGMPVHERHAMERREVHHRHETEHAMHGKGDKKELHSRHEKERSDMVKRHEKEHGHEELTGGTAKSKEEKESKGSGEGKEKIKKVEKEKE